MLLIGGTMPLILWNTTSINTKRQNTTLCISVSIVRNADAVNTKTPAEDHYSLAGVCF